MSILERGEKASGLDLIISFLFHRFLLSLLLPRSRFYLDIVQRVLQHDVHQFISGIITLCGNPIDGLQDFFFYAKADDLISVFTPFLDFERVSRIAHTITLPSFHLTD